MAAEFISEESTNLKEITDIMNAKSNEGFSYLFFGKVINSTDVITYTLLMAKTITIQPS